MTGMPKMAWDIFNKNNTEHNYGFELAFTSFLNNKAHCCGLNRGCSLENCQTTSQ